MPFCYFEKSEKDEYILSHLIYHLYSLGVYLFVSALFYTTAKHKNYLMHYFFIVEDISSSNWLQMLHFIVNPLI